MESSSLRQNKQCILVLLTQNLLTDFNNSFILLQIHTACDQVVVIQNQFTPNLIN